MFLEKEKNSFKILLRRRIVDYIYTLIHHKFINYKEEIKEEYTKIKISKSIL